MKVSEGDTGKSNSASDLLTPRRYLSDLMATISLSLFLSWVMHQMMIFRSTAFQSSPHSLEWGSGMRRCCTLGATAQEARADALKLRTGAQRNRMTRLKTIR